MSEAGQGPREASGTSAAGAGLGLRAAREARGIEASDLARRLKLEPRVLALLETDEFERLPAPAFTRGYVRAIARELGLDPAPLLATLDDRLGDSAPALADFESRAPIQVTSDSRIVRYTTLALVAVMAVLVLNWWQGYRAEPHEAVVVNTGVTAAATAPLSYSFEQVLHPSDPFYRADMPAATLPGGAPTDTAGTAVPSGDGSAAAAAAPTGATDLVIAAREDAWIQVLDVDGERLYYNLVTAGNRVEIAGRRPYSLVIGNAPAVDLLFDGKPVDIEAVSDNGVARFTLGDGLLQ